MDEDWEVLLSFFPKNWIELADKHKVTKGLRKDKDIENFLRILLIHIGCGYSMRETVARAKLSGLADISDVALLGRLKKSKDWLQSLCIELFKEQGVSVQKKCDFPIRLFDATNVKEPGKTGSLWRIHYSLQLPFMACDFFKITATKGIGTGESFFQYSIKKNDHIIADRGYSTAPGIHYIALKKAYVIVRVNSASLPIHNLKHQKFPLLKKIQSIKKAGTIRSWNVLIPNKKNKAYVKGRVCVIRKSNEAIKLAQTKINREASKKSITVRPETLEYAKFIILFTTFSEDSFSDVEILDWYRSRWQIELAFKRLKSIAHLGHLPKHNEDSSKAWLYGKLFVALLTNKLVEHASTFSPWGYYLEE